MSASAAKHVGRSFLAIDRLQLLGLLSDSEARRAMVRLGKSARKDFGLSVSSLDAAGRRLFRQVRISWCSSRGRTCTRFYPSRVSSPRELGF